MNLGREFYEHFNRSFIVSISKGISLEYLVSASDLRELEIAEPEHRECPTRNTLTFNTSELVLFLHVRNG